MYTHFRGSQEWKKENLPLTTGSEEACKLYDAVLTQCAGWYNDESLGGVQGTLEKMKKADENFVMGLVATNGLTLFGTGLNFRLHKSLTDEMNRMIDLAQKTENLTEREKKHVQALDLWSKGFLDKATQVWEDILVEFPTDFLALKYLYTTYIYRGKSYELRDSVAKVLPYWTATTPLYGFLVGMHAFGLEETNIYPEAEAAARKALSINPRDAWATHTLCHVMEMQGRQEEGIHMMESTIQHWEACKMLACHNHWHWALYYLEIGDYESALSSFDKEVGKRACNSGGALDLTDACSLLFRLQMEDVDVGDRWNKIIDACTDRLHDHVYAFVDIHVLIGCLGAGRKEAAKEMMESLEKFVREGQGTNKNVTAEVGEAMAKSFMAYNDGDFASAVDHLLPVRYDVINIGGSHAQRDIFNIFLIQAAIKSPSKKHHKLARNLLNERKIWKPKAPMTDRLIAKIMEAHCD